MRRPRSGSRRTITKRPSAGDVVVRRVVAERPSRLVAAVEEQRRHAGRRSGDGRDGDRHHPVARWR